MSPHDIPAPEIQPETRPADGLPQAGHLPRPAGRWCRRRRTFQLPHEFRALTTIENLLVAVPRQRGESLAGVAAGWPLWRRQEGSLVRRAGALLDLFGMADKKDDRAGQLSGGQKRLLAVIHGADLPRRNQHGRRRPG